MSASVSAWQRRIYSVLTTLAPPLLRRKLARRARLEPGYGQAVPERFGHYEQAAEARSELVWVHAVSLGETRTAGILLKAWRAQQPGLRILLTHGTATGRAEGRALLQEGDVQVWQPWDSPAAVARFFSHFRPRLGVLLETEVWPNLMAAAHDRQLPVVLVNARMSAKSLGQALRLPGLAKPAYAALAGVYAQTPADAERLQQLGAPISAVCGNLKFDATPDPAQQAQGQAWQAQLMAQLPPRPVLMFTSSREGEEAEFLRQWLRLDAVQRQTCQPLIVPRHPQRFDEVCRLIEAQGLRVSRRSSWPASGPLTAEALQADVWLGDSLGEMALYHSLSRVALLGGSFEPLGGQNLIEPAACGCPVIMGPHTFNFEDAAAQASAEGAAWRVPDLASGLARGLALLADPAQQARLSGAALVFAARHRGAAAATVAGLVSWLVRAPASR